MQLTSPATSKLLELNGNVNVYVNFAPQPKPTIRAPTPQLIAPGAASGVRKTVLSPDPLESS